MKILLLLVVGFCTLAQSTVQAADYSYTTFNGTIKINKYTGPGGDVVVPAEIDGLAVTCIGSMAFENCTTLTSITIPDTVTEIWTFVFSGCTNLTKVTFGKGLRSIDRALWNCTGLVTIVLPESVIDLNLPFFGCANLTAIMVEPGNAYFSSVDGVLFDEAKTTLIEYPGGKIGSYAIPETVTNISDHAFEGCTNLAGIVIPEGVRCIGTAAFAGCTKLPAIDLPGSVTNIGDRAFNRCTQLSNVAMPDAVVSLGFNAFASCSNLSVLKLSKALTSIPCGAFLNCTSLTNVSIPGSVTEIAGWDYFASGAFSGCTNLSNIEFGRGLMHIEGGAFRWCSGLSIVTIPASVTGVGWGAFSGCENLTAIFFEGDAPLEYADFFLEDGYPTNAIAYRSPGTLGWDLLGWDGVYLKRPVALWDPVKPYILSRSSSFGLQTNQFGFIIYWGTNVPVVVEASMKLADGPWLSLTTNSLRWRWIYFSDPQWADHCNRLYRVRSE